MSQAQRTYVESELARLPIGARVRVKGAPGLGAGKVVTHITEYVTGSAKNRLVVPLVGHCRMNVEFEDGEPRASFTSNELYRVNP